MQVLPLGATAMLTEFKWTAAVTHYPHDTRGSRLFDDPFYPGRGWS